MTISIFLQSVLDGLLLSLSGFGLLGRSRGKPDRLLPLLFAGVCLLSRLGLGEQETEMAYAVLPVDHIVAFLFLFLGVLLLNSLWFQKSEGHTLFGTLAVFALYLLLREFSLLFLALCGLTEPVWYVYVGRTLSLFLLLVLWSTGVLRWLREKLADGSFRNASPAAGTCGCGGAVGGLRRDCHAPSAAPYSGPPENSDAGAVSSSGGRTD